MQAENFDLNDYLHRIGYTGGRDADPETLTGMMKAQLYRVPFENADVWQGKIVSLVPEEIVEKIVYRGRGGYCYELNGLFCMALEALGFRYTMLSARPRFNYTGRRPKTHMALRVDIGEASYLCDLGFGGYGLREPVDISRLPEESVQGPDRFRVSRLEDGEYLLQVWMEGAWADLYSFDMIAQEWIDYILPNHFNSTAANTIFTQKKLAIIQTPEGRKFLVDNDLSLLGPEGREVRAVADNAYDEVLSREFGIRL